MITRKTKFTVAIAAVLAVCAISVPLALAVANGVVPANTKITTSLKAATKAVFTGTVDGAPATVSCTRSVTTFTTPKTGLLAVPVSNPTFTGCTDSLGGTDTVRTNSTHGKWMGAFTETAGKLTKLRLIVPLDGATVVSSVLPTCTITVAPKVAGSLTATYNNVNTASFKAVVVATAGTGCTTSASAKFTGTYILTPGVHAAT